MQKAFDSHCHLYAKDFDSDRIEVIESAKKYLWGILLVSENLESNRKINLLCKEYPNFLFPAFGVHPEYAHIIDKEQLKEELKWIKKQKPVCIGEIGLDRFWIKKVLKPHQQNRAWQSQINLFECFITLAKELKIPLNVHSRWATRDVLDILDKYKPEKVILHAFSGNLNEAKEAIGKGYFISLGTNILYSEQKRDLVKHLNLTNLLLETDSPVLGPEKGERNEPKNIVYVIKELSLLKKIAEEKIIEVTNENVKRLFFD